MKLSDIFVKNIAIFLLDFEIISRYNKKISNISFSITDFFIDTFFGETCFPEMFVL